MFPVSRILVRWNRLTLSIPPLTPIKAQITLTHPLKRGEKTIESIWLRRPNAGELRGVRLSEVLLMQPEAVATVVARISEPHLPEAQFWELDPVDSMSLCGEVAGFFVETDSQRE